MEYCSHIWGGDSGFTRLLDRVESKAKRLINCSVGAISLFYRHPSGKVRGNLSFAYHHLLPLRCLRSTRSAVSAHKFCVDIGNSRLVRCGASFCSVEFSFLLYVLLNLISLTLKPASVLICVICARG